MAVTLASVDGTWNNAASYDAGELRRADAAMFSSAGVTSGLAVSVNGSDVVTVTAGTAVISGEDAVAGTGVYRAGIAGSVSGSLEARDATNARIDLVVFRQYDTDVVGSHPRIKSEIEIVKGTPSATPVVPTKPSMATELARITVPAAGGGAATVDQSHRIGAAAAGLGGAWATYAPAWTASTTNPAIGNGSLVGRYLQVGKTVHVRIVLTGGSTTTVGSGSYSLSLPVPAASGVEQALAADFYDGANHFAAAGLIASGASVASPFSAKGGASGSIVSVGSASFSAGVAALIVIQGTYEAA